MKNFTKQITNKTLFKPTRWLLMALMLLMGTSSAWASTVYFINSLSWTDIKIYYWGNVSVDWGNSPSMTKENYQINGSDVYKYTFNTDPQNIIFRGNNVQTVDIAFSAGKQWTPNGQWDNGKAKGSWSTYTPPCTKSVSNGTGNYSNGEITLSATYNTCGNAYIGFQWKKQGDGWCYTNDGTETCYKALDLQNKSNEDVETSFTTLNDNLLSGTYVFRPYIVDGSNATNWIYGDEFEVITCSDPSAGYSISNENASVDWDGTEKEVIITTANGYATPSKIYYGGNETKPTAAGEYTITIDVPLNGTYCAATDLEIGTFTITCPTIAAPAITRSATVCAGTQVTLSNYNGVNDNIVKWYSDEECNSEVTEQVTLTDNGTQYNANYYAKAYHEASGCYSSEYSTLTFTVNPLPTISIGDDTNAVKFEDVKLTATGNNITDVTWIADKGTITKDATDPKKAVLTYDQEGEVTVTAKAISAVGCESAEVSKKVTFGEEDCNSTTITDLIITCNPNGYYGDVYLHIWPNGESSLRNWPGFKGEWKDNVWRWEISASLLNTSKKYDIIFNNNEGAQTQDLDHDLIPGNQYNYTLNHTDWGNSNNRPTMSKVDPIPLSQPAAITAPTVKTVYAESDEGEGNIRFKGQIVKTGCNDKAKLAVQYKLDGNDSYTTYYWNNEDKLVDIEAGKEFEITLTNIPDGTYDVRARIYVSDDLKGYGEVITIPVSTIKEPITSVVLTHVKDVNGTAYSAQELANLIYCAGETVWFKLEQNGSKFQDYQWISYPGTDLVGMYAAGTFSFTITDSGNVGIRLKNDANDDWVESNLLEFNTHPVAISPTISFENATICSNSTATLKLGSLVVDQSYELYKEIENEGVYSEERVGDVTLTCNSIEDDLKFTGLNESVKYFVKGYTAQCPAYKASSQTATLEIVDASSVYITLDPTEATTTPWMPAKFTVNASDKYTLNVTKGNPAEAATEAEVSQNGNNVSVKIPLPEGATGGEGQYENVSFPQDSYTVTAKLVSIGGEDNPCAVPATATITLTPYVEECTEGH